MRQPATGQKVAVFEGALRIDRSMRAAQKRRRLLRPPARFEARCFTPSLEPVGASTEGTGRGIDGLRDGQLLYELTYFLIGHGTRLEPCTGEACSSPGTATRRDGRVCRDSQCA
jgi:hypothetical protein